MNYYNAPTEGYWQPPPVPPKKKPWYRSPLGCGALIAVIGLCILASIAAGQTANQQQQAVQGVQVTATATTAAILQVATTVVATPTKKPTAIPTKKATLKPTSTPKPSCNAVGGNPWCYNFSPGNLIYNPPSAFCNYFTCIAAFWGSDDPGDGYIVECQDHTYSQSGGERGACSHHGGELRPLYSH